MLKFSLRFDGDEEGNDAEEIDIFKLPFLADPDNRIGLGGDISTGVWCFLRWQKIKGLCVLVHFHPN